MYRWCGKIWGMTWAVISGVSRTMAATTTIMAPAASLREGGDALRVEPEPFRTYLPADELADHDGKERLDDNGGEDVMHGEVVEGERESYYQIIHTGGNAENDNRKAARGDQCPHLACLVVIIIVIVIEAFVQHPDANGAEDQRDDDRVDIPTEETVLDDVARVTEAGRVNLVGIGRVAVDEQVRGDAGEVGQRRSHGHPEQRHPDLERHEQHADADPLRPGQAHSPQNANRDGEDVKAQRKSEGQQCEQHVPLFVAWITSISRRRRAQACFHLVRSCALPVTLEFRNIRHSAFPASGQLVVLPFSACGEVVWRRSRPNSPCPWRLAC